MSVAHQIAAVLRKDLLLEWRSRARALSVVLFGIVALALFSFAVGAETIAPGSVTRSPLATRRCSTDARLAIAA